MAQRTPRDAATTRQTAPASLYAERRAALARQAKDKMALSVDEVAALCGLGRNSIYAYVMSGALVSFKVRQRRLVLRSEMDRWLANLGQAGRSQAREASA